MTEPHKEFMNPSDGGGNASKVCKITQFVSITDNTTWEAVADIAERISEGEDKSIWQGDGTFDSREQLAAYAYHLGRLDALRGATITMSLSDSEVKAEIFQGDHVLDINMSAGVLHWEDEHGGRMFLIGIRKDDDIRKIVFEREEQ